LKKGIYTDTGIFWRNEPKNETTIERLESKRGTLVTHASTLVMLTRTLEVAGVEFIDENGGGLRRALAQAPEAEETQIV
jgi:hypothetical protein